MNQRRVEERDGGAGRRAIPQVQALERRALLSAAAGVFWAEPTICDADGHAGLEAHLPPPWGEDKAQAPAAAAASGSATQSAATPGAVAESEGNDSLATADVIALDPGGTAVVGTLADADDLDYFRISLAERSGLFVDIDARETGPSLLDSTVAVYDAGGEQLGYNDDGYDFEGFGLSETSRTGTSLDSSLYLDLDAGDYYVLVDGWGGSSGEYELKLRAEAGYEARPPVLANLPGAPATLYLDFDGHASSTDAWATRFGSYDMPAYDFDGDPAYSPGERAAMHTIWRVVAEDFALFNLNVTTVEPPAFRDKVAFRMVIGGEDADLGKDGSLGTAFTNSWRAYGVRYKAGFSFAAGWNSRFDDDGPQALIAAAAVEIGNTASHEFGHALGLDHYEDDGQRGGLMYVSDFGLSRERWVKGVDVKGEFQNDYAEITAGYQKIGFRSDDHGDTVAQATPLGPGGADGLIAVASDVDVFRFEAAGDMSVSVLVSEYLGNLDATLTIYDAAGVTLAHRATEALGEAADLVGLPAGTYYAAVSGAGAVGDVGTYRLEVAVADVRPPGLESFAFDFESGQAVSVRFDEPVAATLAAEDLIVTDARTGLPLPAWAFAFAPRGDGAGGAWTYAAGALPDGDYTAAIAAGAVADAAGNPLDRDLTLDFFVLAGDADRDRAVTIADFAQLRAGFGGPGLFSEGDFNYDGQVTIADFAVLRRNFGTALAPRAAATSLFGDGRDDDAAA